VANTGSISAKPRPVKTPFFEAFPLCGEAFFMSIEFPFFLKEKALVFRNE
jgi:hypothetical protein